MKKLFNTMIALLIFLLVYQFFVTFLINKRDYNYSLATKDNDYLVKEKYNRKKGVNMYSFLITDKDKNSFVYSYKGNFANGQYDGYGRQDWPNAKGNTSIIYEGNFSAGYRSGEGIFYYANKTYEKVISKNGKVTKVTEEGTWW